MKTWQYLVCYAISCKNPFSVKEAAEHLEVSLETSRLNIEKLVDEGKIIKSVLKVKSKSKNQRMQHVYWSVNKLEDISIQGLAL
jgi:DeoR/GlpR family transcriptional regulator of sugar metabolism